MKIVIKEVGEPPRVEEVENELATFQSLVGGYIEVLSMGDGVGLIVNEEGKLIGLPVNFGLGYDTINGTAVFVAFGNDGEFKDLTDLQIDTIMSSFYVRGEEEV